MVAAVGAASAVAVESFSVVERGGAAVGGTVVAARAEPVGPTERQIAQVAELSVGPGAVARSRRVGVVEVDEHGGDDAQFEAYLDVLERKEDVACGYAVAVMSTTGP